MIFLLNCFTFINMSCDRIEKRNLHSRLLPEWKRNNTKRHDERINIRDKLLPSTSLTSPDSSKTSEKSDVKKLDEPTISEEDANGDEDEVLIIKDFCNLENGSIKRKILKDDSESKPALKSTKHEERFWKFKEFTPQKNSVTSYKISKKTSKESKQTKIPIRPLKNVTQPNEAKTLRLSAIESNNPSDALDTKPFTDQLSTRLKSSPAETVNETESSKIRSLTLSQNKTDDKFDSFNEDCAKDSLSTNSERFFKEPSQNINFKTSKIFSFLKENKERYFNVNLIFPVKITSTSLEEIIKDLEETSKKLPIKIAYKEIIYFVESEYFISFRSTVVYYTRDFVLKKEEILKDNKFSKFSKLLQEGNLLLLQEVGDSKNNLANEKNLDVLDNNKIVQIYNEYYRHSFITYSFIFEKYPKTYIKHLYEELLEYNKDNADIKGFVFQNILLPADATFKHVLILLKILERIINNADFKIICLLIPEFEEVIGYVFTENFSIRHLKYSHYIISLVIYKFAFLKENIKNEIKINKDLHTDVYLESPLIKIFIMDVRTLLLVFINRTILRKSKSQLFKVLLYKNILNYIAIKGGFGNEHQNSFYITLIKKDHFELVSFDEIFDHYIDYGSSNSIKVYRLNYHNLNSINGPQKYLTSILNIDNKEKLKIIFNEVKNSTDQIKTHFT